MSDSRTLFQKIIDGDIPGTLLHEDPQCVVLKDINPQGPVHVLIIPREPIRQLAKAQDSHAALLGHLMLVARDMAKKLNIEDGYRVVINNGLKAGESVPHLHLHLIGGRVLSWPPG